MTVFDLQVMVGASSREIKAGTEGRSLTGSLSLVPSDSFLIQARPICPGVAPPTVGGVLPHQSLTKQALDRLATGPSDGYN